jgi:glycosyltransferase involved in cell wall biosynthesis
MNQLLISIVVVTYNQEKYISQALDSILEQEHTYPYEIIVADDCSKDNTKSILLEYKNKFPDIITLLLNENNYGLIRNYFNVISYCSGKYIMQCAGDDYWLPGKVEAQIRYMEEHFDVGMCYGKVLQYYQKAKKYSIYPFGDNCTLDDIIKSGKRAVPALSICMRREVFLHYLTEIEPETKEWLVEDYPLVLWFLYNNKIYCINKIVGVYRVLEESASHSSDMEKIEKLWDSVIDIKVYFLKLYNEYSSDFNVYDEKYIALSYEAAIRSNYKLYKKYVFQIKEINSKNKIRRVFGKIHPIFLVYCIYLNIKKIFLI